MALLSGVTRARGWLDLPEIHVAHLNHGLRGPSGHRDAEFVRTECEKIGVPVVVAEIDPEVLGRESQGSLEEAARNARYEFLKSTAVQLNATFVVTAHHAADQAETILHHIIRGTGLRGLRGIPKNPPEGS